jgi:hypothetical protein
VTIQPVEMGPGLRRRRAGRVLSPEAVASSVSDRLDLPVLVTPGGSAPLLARGQGRVRAVLAPRPWLEANEPSVVAGAAALLVAEAHRRAEARAGWVDRWCWRGLLGSAAATCVHLGAVGWLAGSARVMGQAHPGAWQFLGIVVLWGVGSAVAIWLATVVLGPWDRASRRDGRAVSLLGWPVGVAEVVAALSVVRDPWWGRLPVVRWIRPTAARRARRLVARELAAHELAASRVGAW